MGLRVQQGYRTFIFLCDYAFNCHSFGGASAIRAAIQHPDKARRLVVISSPHARSAWYPETQKVMSQVSAAMAENVIILREHCMPITDQVATAPCTDPIQQKPRNKDADRQVLIAMARAAALPAIPR